MRHPLPVFVLLACAAGTASAELRVVNSAADPGNGVCDASECTLREAIVALQASGDFSNLITFAIPGGGTRTITLQTPLPAIDYTVEIDGFSQPGATPPNFNTGFGFVPALELDGSALPDSGAVHGFRLRPGSGDFIDVSGFAIVGFSRPDGAGSGVLIDGAGGGQARVGIGGSFIGLRPDGVTARGNDVGVRVAAGHDVDIGSFNDGANIVSGNRVGVLGNGRGGSLGFTVSGNRIGTTANGNTALPNSEDGIRIVSGCAAPANALRIVDNTIAGNGRDGIHLTGESASCNVLGGTFNSIAANRIGLGASGGALGNTRHGIFAGLLASDILEIGSPLDSNFDEDRNDIRHNGGAGIAVPDGAGAMLARMNRYGGNTGLPIDLGPIGPTPNDPCDADTGGNRRLNSPELSGARVTGGQTTLQVRSSSATTHAAYPLVIDFYSRDGESYLFLDTHTLDAPGVPKQVTLPGQLDIVAMASDADGNSSEFSSPAERVLFADGFE